MMSPLMPISIDPILGRGNHGHEKNLNGGHRYDDVVLGNLRNISGSY